MNNHSTAQNNDSKVREAVRRFDRIGRSNEPSRPPPPLPPPPPRPPVSSNMNNNYMNHTHGAATSSISSSSGSSVREYAMNPREIEQRKAQSREKATNTISTVPLKKPQVFAARIYIPTATQQKHSANRRRSPPPVPPKIRDYTRSKQNRPIPSNYENSDDDAEDNQFDKQPNGLSQRYEKNGIEEPKSFRAFAIPAIVYKEPPASSSIQNNEHIRSKVTINGHRRRGEKSTRMPKNSYSNDDIDSIGLEIDEPVLKTQRRSIANNGFSDDRPASVQSAPSIIPDYELAELQGQRHNAFAFSHRPPPPPPPPAFAVPYLDRQPQPPQPKIEEESQPYTVKRTLPLSTFVMEIGALLVVFLICMVLVLAIREDETKLRTTMQLVYTYVYAISIIWMIWCSFDILKFRRHWMDITAHVQDHEEYMGIVESHPKQMAYFPDIHNTGGLFLKVGAGFLCMGSLTLTLIKLAETIVEMGSNGNTRDQLASEYSPTVSTTKALTHIFRFLFHCVQFTFLFRYGNVVIDRYHLIAKIGLIHVVIANFCTWFEAIVFETLEQLHKDPVQHSSTPSPSTTTVLPINETNNTQILFNFIKASSVTSTSTTLRNASTLEILRRIESSVGVYLYPFLIEYSLISLTVFFIVWRNVGKAEERSSYLHFGDRHVFTVNCSRASRGLLVGGIIFLSTILTLIPTYLLDEDAISVTHITELVLLSVSLATVCISYCYTTKLYYDRDAHVNPFDQVLILITTVGDFAYSFFGVFASILTEHSEKSQLPISVDISIGFLAILQTFLQTGFIMDTLKRRTTTRRDLRKKPGREAVTALLLMNLAIWLLDSLSAKKVRLNPIQSDYYDIGTWAIIQAFTSPLSIFYRFHSSVCLADIWQEVYKDSGNNIGIKKQGGNHGTHRMVKANGVVEN